MDAAFPRSVSRDDAGAGGRLRPSAARGAERVGHDGPVALTWAQLADMRTRGTQFEYQELSGISHGQTTVASMDQTMEVIDRLMR
ncbi:hypothetical protein [Rhodococcus sp. P-2]|uniref:hypothetical protein n=1 Tax=Rhodococcus sp. P-2 TaxID=2795031 RepID=UPI001F2738BD|nr:hypothetical protein [Rhodococcus sp. P-2]